MTATTIEHKKQYFYNDRLPLAVYREIVAHLESIAGVQTGTITQDYPEFDYSKSQLKGIWIETEEVENLEDKQQIQQILAHYGLD